MKNNKQIQLKKDKFEGCEFASGDWNTCSLGS